MKIKRGRIRNPYKLVLHGDEGVGKTTFAAGLEKPIFICTEHGSDNLDIARATRDDGVVLESYTDVKDVISWLRDNDHEFRTVVVDTIDALTDLMEIEICEKQEWRSVSAVEFGKGWAEVLEAWRWFSARLDELRNKKQMNIVLIGHSDVKRQNDPDKDPFDRYVLRLYSKAANHLKSWTDMFFFTRYEVGTIKKNGKVVGVSTGRRVVHTRHTAAYDAKSRFWAPDAFDLDATAFAQVMELNHELHDADEEKREKVLAWVNARGTDAIERALEKLKNNKEVSDDG